jgi:hypothetical protein
MTTEFSVLFCLGLIQLAALARLIYSSRAMEIKEMASIDNLTAAVTAEETVVASVEALLTTLVADITAANNGQNPAIDAITAKITADTAALSAAVVANTPAAPAT